MCSDQTTMMNGSYDNGKSRRGRECCDRVNLVEHAKNNIPAEHLDASTTVCTSVSSLCWAINVACGTMASDMCSIITGGMAFLSTTASANRQFELGRQETELVGRKTHVLGLKTELGHLEMKLGRLETKLGFSQIRGLDDEIEQTELEIGETKNEIKDKNKEISKANETVQQISREMEDRKERISSKYNTNRNEVAGASDNDYHAVV